MDPGQETSTNDMAVCFILFNPAKSKRIVMNALYVKNHFEIQGFPVFFLELVYEGRQPEVNDAFHVSCNSYMFHKENLYRILESKIPSHFTKLAFLDADIYFLNASWYSKASELLETYDVVQPFELCHWLDLSYTISYRTAFSILCKDLKKWDCEYHHGFAWCMRRDWYKQVGFFDCALTGGGDEFSCAAWLGDSSILSRLPTLLLNSYSSFLTHPKPKITYIQKMEVFHLYHGSLENRQYKDRHNILCVEGQFEEIVEKKKEGLWEWKKKEIWNPVFLDYFTKRHDDAIPEKRTHSIPFWTKPKK